MIPKDLRYLETHEWARREGQTDIVTVGISDFAIEQLGDIVFLELPQMGETALDHVATARIGGLER